MLKIISIVFGTAALGATLLAGRTIALAQSHRTEKASDSSVSADGATVLRLKVPIASIVLETGNMSNLSVHAVRWTKTPDSPAGKQWMSEAVLSVARSGDVLDRRASCRERV